MGWPRRLVLVRHAQSEGNTLTADERAAYEQPTFAYQLTKRGRMEAEYARYRLLEAFPRGFDVYYSSYYARAKETLKIIAPSDAKLYTDERLAEGQRGIYHTYTKDEVERLFPKEILRKQREGLYHHRPLGGENWPDIELRIRLFLQTLARDCDGLDVLIVVHGHWLILLQKLLEHFDEAEAERRYRKVIAPNASITVYEGRPRHWWKPWKRDALVLKYQHANPWWGVFPEDSMTTAPPA